MRSPAPARGNQRPLRSVYRQLLDGIERKFAVVRDPFQACRMSPQRVCVCVRAQSRSMLQMLPTDLLLELPSLHKQLRTLDF
jgi:hypothetical protein